MGIVAKQSGWNLVSGYMGTLLGALNTLLLFPATFPENPEMMGSIRWVLSTSLVISAFVHWGWPQAMVTWLPKLDQMVQRRVFNFGRSLISWTLLLLLLLTYWKGPELVSYVTNDSLSGDWSPWIWVLVATYAYFELHAAILIHNQRVVLPYVLKDSGRKLTITVLLLGTMLGWLTFDQMVAGLLIIYAAMTALVTLGAYRMMPARATAQTTWSKRPIVNYALTMLLTTSAVMMFGQLDIMMVGAWLGMDAVSQYAIVLNFGLVVAMPMKAMNASLRPLIAKLVASESWAELETMCLRAVASQWFAASGIFLLVLMVAPWLLAWLPPAYQGGAGALIWLASAQLIHVTTGPSGLVIVSSSIYRWGLYANVIMLIMALGLGWYWIPIGGVVGASQVFFVAVVSLNLFKVMAIMKLTGSAWIDWRLLGSMLWTAIAASALIALLPSTFERTALLSMDTALLLLVSAAVVLIWFMAGLFIMNLAPDLKSQLHKIINWLT